MRPSRLLPLASTLIVALLASSPAGCGGGSGGPGPAGAGQGLLLSSFIQDGRDNMSLNQVLEFRFSEAVDASTIDAGSLQVRAGPSFGLTANGSFEVDGATVRFFPHLPGVCGYDDAGFTPGTTYRVTLLGAPEEFAIRNTKGQPLAQTVTLSFSTLPEGDPSLLEDQVPGALPSVLSTTPQDEEEAVSVTTDDELQVDFSENVDPCSLKEGTSVKLSVYETGDKTVFLPAPNGNASGFDPVEDSTAPPFTWGGNATALPTPQHIPCTLLLEQSVDETVLHVRPNLHSFPEDCLLVLTLTGDITDFGGNHMAPRLISFTTENLPITEKALDVGFDDATPVEKSETTADVNTARSPGRAQGWLSYGGDGDNGASLDIPSWPILDSGTYAFKSCDTQPNDGTKDDFDPSSDVTLHTGRDLLPKTCTNDTDGSHAVVFEFASFRIRSGVTVTIDGVNPCVILVNGNVSIEAGGVLRVTGRNGSNGDTNWQAATGGAGGAGGPGGGVGGAGDARNGNLAWPAPTTYATDGTDGYGSPDAFVVGGTGGGHGGLSFDPPNGVCGAYGGSGQGGGGGGHAADGATGEAKISQTEAPPNGASIDGAGGGTYGDANGGAMYTPVAGSGGGGGGYAGDGGGCNTTGNGGGGGGGGGFLGITASGSIDVAGTIDARGGNGGTGANGPWSGGAGGGGGSGGGVRLLTPNDISVSGATITTAGGSPGLGHYGTSAGYTPYYANKGGAGGNGRIVLEDGDSVIQGLAGATLVPDENQPGFYRAQLHQDRFISGGTESVATTQPMALGAIIDPDAVVVKPLVASDLVAGIPAGSAPSGGTPMVVELQGYRSTPSGDIDLGSASGWYTVGYFTDSGIPNEPTWHSEAAPPGWVPDAGVGVGALASDATYVQVRITFRLSDALTTTDPGPFVDQLRIRYTADN